MKLYDFEHFALNRKRAGKSQQEVAIENRLSQSYVAQAERGLRNLTPSMKAYYPNKIKKMFRHEVFWILLRRAGIEHGRAKKLFCVTAREWNQYMNGTKRVPDNALDYLFGKLQIKKPGNV
jgi:hypothetical protein